MFRDPISAQSHWLMGAYSLLVTLFLLRSLRRQPGKSLLVAIFGFSATLLYCLSGLFHTVHVEREMLRVFQKWDMTAIYIMIAGSCTPIVGILLRGWFRSFLLIGEWLFAAVGIAIIWSFQELNYSALVISYLSMGMLGCLGIWHYWKATGWRGFGWAISGVVFYSLGAVCELTDQPVIWAGVIGSHELFHLATSIGTLCHMVFIIKYVVPYQGLRFWGKSLPVETTLGTVAVRGSGILSEEARRFPERLPSIS